MANATLILGGRVSLAWRCPSEHCARCFAALCLFLRPKCEESRRGWVFAESAPRLRAACFDGECLPGTDPKASGGNATLLALGSV